MSHFSVGVILPRLNATEMNAEIERLLEPYNENLKVDEYDHECYCINGEARKYGRDMANKLVGTWQERKELFHQQFEAIALAGARQIALKAKDWDTYDKVDSRMDATWAVFAADFAQQWHETERDYTEYHPRYNQPDADCDECHGSGTYRSTYNPASKWDWYRVGGRFDGKITDNEQSSENGFNFDAKHETLANNSVPVQELLDRHTATGSVFRSYALVTPEGEWIERGRMGWWGMSSGDKSESVWDDQLLTIYRKYATLDIVLLDCHI